MKFNYKEKKNKIKIKILNVKVIKFFLLFFVFEIDSFLKLLR